MFTLKWFCFPFYLPFCRVLIWGTIEHKSFKFCIYLFFSRTQTKFVKFFALSAQKTLLDQISRSISSANRLNICFYTFIYISDFSLSYHLGKWFNNERAYKGEQEYRAEATALPCLIPLSNMNVSVGKQVIFTLAVGL